LRRTYERSSGQDERDERRRAVRSGAVTASATELLLPIGGSWSAAAGGATYESENPFAGTSWAVVPDAASEDVDRAVQAARSALAGPWGSMTGTERGRLLRRLADILTRDSEALGLAETTDNGKLLREMSGQTAYLPEWFHYFAGLADKIHGDAIPSDRPNFFAYTRHEPVGVVGAITPWNSPLLLLAWKAAPALAAGCTMVVKPSDSTPVSTLEFARRVEEAGLPGGVFNVVTGRGPAAGAALASHPGIDKLAFTGSTRVGIAVAKQAAENVTPVLLELGGKSAQVVFADADLELTANGIIAGIFAASGQTCLAGSRLLVDERVHDALVDRIVARARTIVLGDPRAPETEMGPLANAKQLETVLGFLARARDAGATVAHGGGQPAGTAGYFVEPTVITDVDPQMEIAREEIFGPVLAVMRFQDEDEAVAMANDSRYGLAAGVWTQNVQRAHRVAHRIQAGSVFINSYRIVAPNVPFGGRKHSGWGRESGIDAVREFTETKAVWLELTGETRDPFKLG
jgi:aldehyde dehydrogenase (NAD+)